MIKVVWSFVTRNHEVDRRSFCCLCRESGPPAVPKREREIKRLESVPRSKGRAKEARGWNEGDAEWPNDDRDDEPERMIEDATTKL